MFYETLIIIMKKNIWLWALAGLFMVSCSSNDDEPNIERPVTEDDWEGPNGQVVIQLGGGESTATANTTVTRTPITEKTFIGTEVGVFALATTPNNDTPATDWSTTEGALLSNVQGIISTQTNTEGSETGAEKISLYRNGTSGAVYYYPMDNKYDYTFYGYAPFQEDATVTASQATVQFNDFNGSQDIMWNKAAAPQIPEGSIYIDEDTNEKNSTVITGYKAKYIRQLKYNHDIITKQSKDDGKDYTWVPNIKFNHLLTQFTFQVVAAKKQSEADKKKVKDMKVKDIKIKNHGRIATLDIISGTLTWTGSEDIAMLENDIDEAANKSFTPSNETNGGDKVGYLMAKPTDGTTPLELEVTIEAPTATSGTAIPTEQTVPVFINTTGGFKPGVIYNVQIGIYAMQEVQADATLTEWQQFDDNIEAPVE